MRPYPTFLAWSVPSLCLVACGGSTATLRFANALADGHSTKQGLNAHAPAAFGMKLAAVYLAEDVDLTTQNNRGATEMIWLNPTCEEDIGRCDVSPGHNNEGRTIDRIITDFFDFNSDSATVNTALNAQARAIAPGTYRYARVEFCKGNEGQAPTVQWSANGEAAHAFFSHQCGATSVAFDPPLEVTAAQGFAVTLRYDLSGTVQDFGPAEQRQGGDCVTTPTGTSCFNVPQFVPSATPLR